jgi:hypothetical protein
MSRKSVLLGLAILLLLVGGTAAVVGVLLYHEPQFYRETALPPGEERQKHSQEFVGKCSHLFNSITYDREWRETFTEAQINSYFDEDFIKSAVSDRVLPEGIRDPRVTISPERVRLAFRYNCEPWCNTVVSIDLKVWLTQEVNVVALEVESLKAGSLPISAQSLLERVSEVARRQDIEVPWYRHQGNPVALLRFQANQSRPTIRLQHLELRHGELVIEGRSADDATPVRSMLNNPSFSMKTEGD